MAAELRRRCMAMRQPGDTVWEQQDHIVRLPSARDWVAYQRYVVEPEAWCRANVDHDAGQVWCRKADVDPDRADYRPVFSFNDSNIAFHFKLTFV